MREAIKPFAKVVYVCDDVVRDPQTGKVSLLNLWDTIHLPVGNHFPYQLAKVVVFVWWRDGLGKIKTHIDIVQASTGDAIRRTPDFILDFEERTTSVFARYKLQNCVFPEPGFYYIELYCENKFVDDQIIQVLPP